MQIVNLAGFLSSAKCVLNIIDSGDSSARKPNYRQSISGSPEGDHTRIRSLLSFPYMRNSSCVITPFRKPGGELLDWQKESTCKSTRSAGDRSDYSELQNMADHAHRLPASGRNVQCDYLSCNWPALLQNDLNNPPGSWISGSIDPADGGYHAESYRRSQSAHMEKDNPNSRTGSNFRTNA